MNFLQDVLPDERTDDIDGEDVLKAIEAQHGIFVEQAKGLFSFAHLSFQEYYTACYFAEAPENRLPCLMNFVGDSRWREVFLLTAGMLDDADGFFCLIVRELEDLVSNDERLHTLLVKGERDLFKDRLYMLLLRLYIVATLAPEHVSNVTLAFAQVFTLAYISALNLSADLGYPFDSECALNLAIDLDDGLALTLAFALIIDRPDDRYYKVLEMSKEMGLESCNQSLLRLAFPPQNAGKKVWQNFAESLYKIFKKTFCIEDYEFTKEQVSVVYEYLYVTELVFDCLKVACVSDRAAIEDRLLRPVEHSSKKLNPT